MAAEQHPPDFRPAAAAQLELEPAKAGTGRLRHLIAVLALSSVVLANVNRQVFNQALVKMIRPGAGNGSEADDDTFEWSGGQISSLQAAFSYGYMPFMIPGGRLSELYGAKWVVLLSGLGSAACCLLVPTLADLDYRLLLASRVFMGVCQTGVSPALYALLTRWLTPEEASVYLPMTKVAVTMGLMLGSLTSGFCHWRLSFYLVGATGAAWSALWLLLASSEPAQHRLIGAGELQHIRAALAAARQPRPAGGAAPWLGMLTNPVVLAFMATKFTVKMSTDMQTMQLPLYLDRVLHLGAELNGALVGLNYGVQTLFTGLVAYSAKELVARRPAGLTKTAVRRLFQGLNSAGMGAAFALIALSADSAGWVLAAVALLSLASMFGAGGEVVLPVDLSLEFAASIMAVANSAANLSGVLLPSLVAALLAGQLDSGARWQLVWLALAALNLAGALLFVCLVRAEPQHFRRPKLLQQRRRYWLAAVY